MSGRPEVVAHQPAGLVVHLPPLGGRVDLAAQPAQVDLDDRVAVALGVGLDPPVGRHDPDRVAVADQQPARRRRSPSKPSSSPTSVARAALGEVPALQRRPGVLAVRGGAGPRRARRPAASAQPDQPAAGRAQRRVARRGRDRHRAPPAGRSPPGRPAPAAAGRRRHHRFRRRSAARRRRRRSAARPLRVERRRRGRAPAAPGTAGSRRGTTGRRRARRRPGRSVRADRNARCRPSRVNDRAACPRTAAG